MGCRTTETNRARLPKTSARKRERNPPEWFTFLGGMSQRHRGALKISTRCRAVPDSRLSQRHRGALKISTTPDSSQRHRGALKISTTPDSSQRHRGALKISTTYVPGIEAQWHRGALKISTTGGRDQSQRHRGALKISTTPTAPW